MKIISGGITAPKGFLASGVFCGLKKNKNKKDMALIYSESECNVAAVYTTNKVKGEPIRVTMEHLQNKKAQAIIINSGNANTCTGQLGFDNAKEMTRLTAESLKINQEDVVVASTGVIGVQLDMEAVKSGIPNVCSKMTKDGFIAAREAIMTTDTIKKDMAIEIEIDGKKVVIAGMAKGSGMIHPNMATMLSFITTDVDIDADLLDAAIKESTEFTYNMISVDGDTSTNDMAIVFANGKAENKKITEKDSNYKLFLDALNFLNTELAKLMAKDGEGATKLIETRVYNSKTLDDAKKVAKAIVASSLVKTAMFGADANWGRILCAAGYSGVEINPSTIDVSFESSKGYIKVCENGAGIEFSEEKAKEILSESEITIHVDIKDGEFSTVSWGCDLSYEYVRINGDYRS
jgi:glutamate N-acetyltransferase/amino-acid N-acetyltransferase